MTDQTAANNTLAATLLALYQRWEGHNKIQTVPYWKTNPDINEIITPSETLKTTWKTYKPTDKHQQTLLAGWTDITKEQQQHILASKNETALTTLAQNEHCHITTYQQLRKKRNHRINLALASNPNCPAEILQQLHETINNEQIHKIILKNSACPKEILQQELENGCPNVNELVDNPNCPEIMLEHIIQNLNAVDYIHLTELVVHPKINNKLAKLLHQQLSGKENNTYYTYDDIDFIWLEKTGRANQVHHHIFQKLLENPPDYNLLGYPQITNPQLDGILQKHINQNTLESLTILTHLAANPNLNPDQINQLVKTSQNSPFLLNANLIANKATDEATINLLLQHNTHRDELLRHTIKNPNCPTKLLQQLYQNSNTSNEIWTTQTAEHDLLQNPNCPPEASAYILQNTENLELTMLAAKNLLNINWNKTGEQQLIQTLKNLSQNRNGGLLHNQILKTLAEHTLTQIQEISTATQIWITKYVKEQNYKTALNEPTAPTTTIPVKNPNKKPSGLTINMG